MPSRLPIDGGFSPTKGAAAFRRLVQILGAMDATDYFQILTGRVVEVGTQVMV